MAATSVGRARRVLELSTGWAATRKQFGQPIGRFQGVGFSLADMATEIEAAELLTLRAAWRLDQGQMSDADAAMAKLYASEMLGRVTDQAVQIFGGMGLMSDFRSSGSGATRGSSGSGTGPARSSGTSSRARCCGRGAPDMAGRMGAGAADRPAEAGVLEITLDRPPANAIDVATSRALYEAFARLRATRTCGWAS